MRDPATIRDLVLNSPHLTSGFLLRVDNQPEPVIFWDPDERTFGELLGAKQIGQVRELKLNGTLDGLTIVHVYDRTLPVNLHLPEPFNVPLRGDVIFIRRDSEHRLVNIQDYDAVTLMEFLSRCQHPAP
jgi:hypothetical protein